MALGVMVTITSCGGEKKTTDEASSNETVEEVAAEPETIELVAAEPEKVDETINGLVPGAEYEADIDDWKTIITLYKDGTATSSLSGDGRWHIESIRDQPFVVISFDEVSGVYYIDQKQNLHLKSAGSKGFELERVNYIPEGANGPEMGVKYTMPKYRWGRDAYITFNNDGTVSTDFDSNRLDYTKWKNVDVEGKQWILVTNNDETTNFLLSPSLEYYLFVDFVDRKIIKYTEGQLTFYDDNWRKKLSHGRLKK